MTLLGGVLVLLLILLLLIVPLSVSFFRVLWLLNSATTLIDCLVERMLSVYFLVINHGAWRLQLLWLLHLLIIALSGAYESPAKGTAILDSLLLLLGDLKVPRDLSIFSLLLLLLLSWHVP